MPGDEARALGARREALMSGEQALSGPDLGQGVALSEIPAAAGPGAPGAAAEGGCLLGHAGGEAVLLVRTGGEVFAVAANCTHYGGPLAEGLLVGDTVRCPWHHACFSLRTGEALRAPALNPLARYRVEVQGDRVYVREKLKPPAPSVTLADGAAAVGPASVVIAGAGAAGNAAALALRRAGYGGAITLVGADEAPPYDRPNLSKDYLAGNAPEEWIPLHPPEHFTALQIDLRVGRRVTAIDPRHRTVTLDDGGTLSYGALLLATGADPVHLPVPGGDLPHVHYLRTLADSRAIVANVQEVQALQALGADPPPGEPPGSDNTAATPRAVVVGASFIGLEVAAALRARGLAVAVIGPHELPLATILGREVGAFVRALHEEHGVTFHLGRKLAAIDAGAVTLDDGSRLDAGLVVIGAGVLPAVGLAEAAGLAVENGVLVNEYLETSAPGIYAAGDIARWPDPHTGERQRVEHWVVAERQGQTAAANILGRRVRFDAAPFFWSQHYDVQISVVGYPVGESARSAPAGLEVRVEGSLAGHDATVTWHAGGRIRAVATIFRDRQSLAAELAMERGDDKALAAAVAAVAG
jgi:NADPH-dependent 2,4-dienoyl-CoA reductase/sulfur reductase-like enzyme/nitrite reductase/ring-hydroxylating ferredoxin subunit